MRPLILDFAIDRTNSIGDISYKYDFQLSLNTILENGEKKPFIDSDISTVLSRTITKEKPERDEKNTDLLEMSTKTRVRQESDDRSPLLLLATKTLVRNESDD